MTLLDPRSQRVEPEVWRLPLVMVPACAWCSKLRAPSAVPDLHSHTPPCEAPLVPGGGAGVRLQRSLIWPDFGTLAQYCSNIRGFPPVLMPRVQCVPRLFVSLLARRRTMHWASATRCAGPARASSQGQVKGGESIWAGQASLCFVAGPSQRCARRTGPGSKVGSERGTGGLRAEAAPGLPKRRTCAALGDPQLWEWREESVASEQRNGKRDALASSQGQDLDSGHPRSSS